MSETQAARVLRTEDLYRKVIESLDPVYLEMFGESPMRVVLDAILSQGKIEGRMTALAEIPPSPGAGEVWRLKETPDRTVSVVEVTMGSVVVYRHLSECCARPYHEYSGHESRTLLGQFVLLYEPVTQDDRLIEGWQRIVDSVL